MAYLTGLAAIALTIYAAWWIRGRRHLDLSSALDAPWWLWPLMRIAIYWYWQREGHEDLVVLCGWIDGEGKPTRRSRQYISIRQGDDGRFLVRIYVKRGFPQGDEEEDSRGSRKMQVVNHARNTLGLGPVDFEWKWRLVRGSHVVLTPKKLIPTEAKYHEDADVRAAFHLATKDVIVPAIGKGDQPVKHSLVSDDPHGFVSGATKGGCKTSTLRVIAVQQYLAGAELLICDGIKQFSHVRWAINPDTEQPWPGITYADTVDECAHQIMRARALMDARNARTRRVTRRGGKAPVFPRLIILLDDANHLETEFKRNSHQAARDALAALLLAGREVFINLFAAFQDATALAAGSTTNRAQYGLRMICEYGGSSRNNNKVAPQVQLPPCIPSGVQPGWCVVVHGALHFEAQRILIDETDARRLVAEAATRRLALPEPPEGRGDRDGDGGVNRPPPLPPTRPLQATPSGLSLPTLASSSMQAIEAVSRVDGIDIGGNDGGIEYLTLRDIAGQMWCPWTYETVRKYARDEPSFPPPIDGFENPRRWSMAAVQLWIEERQADIGHPGVYVIGLETETTVKIGETKNLERRLDELALGGLPRADVVQHWFPCPTKKIAQELEDWFRRKYGEQRVGNTEFHRKEGGLVVDLGDDDRMLAGCPWQLLRKVQTHV